MIAEVLVDLLNHLFRWVSAIDEELLHEPIVWRIQQQTCGRIAVATSTTCFLIVRLQATGDVVMHDESHVGFIDPHAERIGGRHDVGTSLHEDVLETTPIFGGQATVVGNDAPP